MNTFAGSFRSLSRVEKALVVVELTFGVAAVGGGIGLITDMLAMSDEFLEGTVFDSYLIPGLALACLVGGSMLAAAWATLTAAPYAFLASIVAAVMVVGWFVVQFAAVGYVSWLQPVLIAFGLVQLGLTLAVFRGRVT